MAAGDVQMLHWQDSLIANLASGYANTTGRTIAMRHPSGLLSDGFNVAPLSKPSGPFTQGYVSQGPGEVMTVWAAVQCCLMTVCVQKHHSIQGPCLAPGLFSCQDLQSWMLLEVLAACHAAGVLGSSQNAHGLSFRHQNEAQPGKFHLKVAVRLCTVEMAHAASLYARPD